jgi:hypothetical protein
MGGPLITTIALFTALCPAAPAAAQPSGSLHVTPSTAIGGPSALYRLGNLQIADLIVLLNTPATTTRLLDAGHISRLRAWRTACSRRLARPVSPDQLRQPI